MIASRGATMAVDWEQRVDYSRLRADRLQKTRDALQASDLGALLLFDQNNIRYVTSTHIGEWARDKSARCVLVPRVGDPVLWDFGSAARHHQLYAPWLPESSWRPGVTSMRGAMPEDTGAPDLLADHVFEELREHGLEREPLGIDLTDMETLASLHRRDIPTGDAQPVMLSARKLKTADEIALLDHAAAIVDAVYERIYELLRPGIREHEIVAEAQRLLFELGSEQVEAINAVSGDRCNPHPHVFSDRLLRPGDQAFFDIIHSFMGYRTCYYRTFCVGSASRSQLDAYKQCREWLDNAIDLVTTRRVDRRDCGGLADRRGAGVRQRGGLFRPPVRPWPRRRPLRGADDLAPALVRQPGRDRGRDGVRPGDLLSRERRTIGGADRGGGARHARWSGDPDPLPGGRAARRRPPLRARSRPRRTGRHRERRVSSGATETAGDSGAAEPAGLAGARALRPHAPDPAV